MKVLYHHRTRGRGAEGVHIKGIVKGFEKLGHDVQVLSMPGAEPEQTKTVKTTQPSNNKRSIVGSLTSITKYFPEFLFEVFELAYNLLALLRVRKALKDTESELVYERYSLFMFASIWYAKRKGIPILLEINDSCLVQRVRKLTFKSLARKLEKWCFQNASGLIFISTHFKELAIAQYGDIANSVVSPNAADLSQFSLMPEEAKSVREQLNIDDKIVLGYVGAFVHWHGIDWFIDKVADKVKDFPNLVLLLIGDGVCFNAIKARIEQAEASEQIILTGRLAHDDVPRYIAAMDFGILPDSNDYGSPMKLFEFMAMEKAMVVPDFGPIKEVVADGETGWLFKANDKDACVEKTLSLMEDKASIVKVGKQARQYIEEQRQWTNNVEDALALLEQNE
ncbi:glycosyltransferase family 4 protein [Thalassotalea agarivorans]|uniref:Glycosyltransferase involved in cell wall bisynthesis n=1 Tax=Thalassotalea agarivorans TaxID=349064 RepID=A0A1I0DXC1_THASX|nr:glycosyltransferase family 4 protein [Thalassotalea agarivorans]SET37045.1 Glycosyltransferase involved in cell wall bisynthesis [Thalassotalea agarivorans]